LNADKKPTTTNSQIRSAAKLARANMQDRDSASQIIASRVINSRYFLSAKTIACYLPMHDEVDTAAIFLRSWRAKKRIFAPVIDSQGTMKFREILPNSPLVQNFFGLWEPTIGEEISPRKLDTVITPLVAFDQKLNRIGMGGGYYDRCFAFLKHRQNCRRPKLIGTAFTCQETANIAPNPWDIPLYRIITEADKE
jgi:5-formyltetrahydrofolate cyclo-ligase